MMWSLIKTRGSPPTFWYHSATIIGTKMFVFGGLGHEDNNIRVFDTETSCWLSTTSTQLCPEKQVHNPAFCYNGEMYVFDVKNRGNDLWKFIPGTYSWMKVKTKSEDLSSMMHNLFCCLVGDRVILFGGFHPRDDLHILDLNPSLKMLCKLAVIQYGLQQSELPHNIRWELTAMGNGRGPKQTRG